MLIAGRGYFERYLRLLSAGLGNKFLGEISEEEAEKGFKWLSETLKEKKYDGKMLTPETLKRQLRLYLAMKKVNEERGFDFCGIKGQRDLKEHVVITDVAEMLMNDPYDWNGSKEPFICSTKADSLGALTIQILEYIGGNVPVLFADVRLYVPEKDLWLFVNSGNHASFYASLSYDPKENLSKVTLHPAIEMYFLMGGASVEFDVAPTEMTFARLGLYDDKLYMVIVRGDSIDLTEEEKEPGEQTNPPGPTCTSSSKPATGNPLTSSLPTTYTGYQATTSKDSPTSAI